MKRLQLAAGTTFAGAWLMSYRAGHGSSAEDVQALFKLLNNLDTVKIVLLAIMIAAASLLARQRRLPGLARDRRPRTGGASRAQWARLSARQRRSLCGAGGNSPRAAGVGRCSDRRDDAANGRGAA